ncbi:hypothetical protein [Porphyromonas sp.]|uniref:hypothetical protein n=1 Tax=Porphyromonas sp. TaxID=1924944 RepID=UPI0026DA8574|nr:hypothetical protein [Porphyromonas sp.]MDO4707889.1 hypothetical protein [Porphyromonadaceae bacterium]MDO4771591.1 hypothetical protein [Porphyromonas sp.]
MSVCVIVRSQKDLLPDEIFDWFLDGGESIVVTSGDFPSIKLGTHLEALRGIEINQEIDGYEVRVCSYASIADYRLFGKAVRALMSLTGGRAYLENDDENEITNPLQSFDDCWIQQQRESDFSVMRLMTNHSGSPMVMFGLFFKFCVGARLYQRFGIPMTGDYKRERVDELQDYLLGLQWYLANSQDTSSQLVVAPEAGDADNQLTISAIYINGGKVDPFDYISEASLFGMIDMDNTGNPPVLIPFGELWKILPGDIFCPIDDLQYERTGEVSVEMVRQMMARARQLEPNDLHYRPTYPGKGFDEQQNTLILKWDPEMSGVSVEDHNKRIPTMLTAFFYWTLYEFQRTKCGDRFFFVKVGAGKTGIVMSGVFNSRPYNIEDTYGRPRFHIDMHPNIILNPDEVPMITTEQLAEAIPSFNWDTCPSGSILPPEDARKLEALWQKYLIEMRDRVDGVTVNAIGLDF